MQKRSPAGTSESAKDAICRERRCSSMVVSVRPRSIAQSAVAERHETKESEEFHDGDRAAQCQD